MDQSFLKPLELSILLYLYLYIHTYIYIRVYEFRFYITSKGLASLRGWEIALTWPLPLHEDELLEVKTLAMNFFFFLFNDLFYFYLSFTKITLTKFKYKFDNIKCMTSFELKRIIEVFVMVHPGIAQSPFFTNVHSVKTKINTSNRFISLQFYTNSMLIRMSIEWAKKEINLF